MELSPSDIWRASVSSLSPSMARSTIPQLRSSAFDIPAETAMTTLQKFRLFWGCGANRNSPKTGMVWNGKVAPTIKKRPAADLRL